MKEPQNSTEQKGQGLQSICIHCLMKASCLCVLKKVASLQDYPCSSRKYLSTPFVRRLLKIKKHPLFWLHTYQATFWGNGFPDVLGSSLKKYLLIPWRYMIKVQDLLLVGSWNKFLNSKRRMKIMSWKFLLEIFSRLCISSPYTIYACIYNVYLLYVSFMYDSTFAKDHETSY